ncbi:glycoside hydrolase family 2 TIM barrel-domain containing protein [Fulvivirgaceae bacterium BMA12]|uniref:Glycoside hydrolase family 2 TIM barrel-domain containing protein n=1 Tax=Agaribacillus aureus TaxID=3051825 RepID=A0ABT8L454_9BACT|nr:glycoside hydrolase family 2 TIM barrel-domain containing protein [Fulvivirgaceae bacterium BMA12]
MKKQFLLIFLLSGLWLQPGLFGQQPSQGLTAAPREKFRINTGWQFYLEKNQGESIQLNKKTATWEPVVLPHTLQLTSLDLDGVQDDALQKTFHRYVGWYRKKLKIADKRPKKVFLEFEGVHQVTNLWINDRHVGVHDVGGYTPFHFDITDYLNFDGSENDILISADNRLNANIPPEGTLYDYIKFSGLYRDVYLVTTDLLHVTFPWEDKNAGVFITTPSVTPEDVTINVKTTVRNESDMPQQCRLLTRIIDREGLVVGRMSSEKVIAANADFTFSQTGGLHEDIRLWSIDDPYLYRVNTQVVGKEGPVDVIENPLGLRKFEFIKDKGFLLNDKPVELIGANRHQAYPYIGDAVPNSLHWKDAFQFKQAGFNIVRLAHYPHDDSFIQACDSLGILLYEEPPTWIGIGGETWFDNLEKATRVMIRNHRNHPSILLWGASINHRGPVERLHYAAKEEDPGRMTASNGSPWTGPMNSAVCDIYTPMDYQNMPLNPNEIVFLCEHGSSADAARNQFEVSKARASANHIGVAVWTAHDYQSFKPRRGLYPRRVFSIFRVPNPVYYWYQSELIHTPLVYVADHRASTDNKVLVFSNCQEVALYHNNELVATQPPDRDPQRLYIDHPSFTFAYPFGEGEFTAKGITNGEVITSHTIVKGGSPYKLHLEVPTDDQLFYADGSSIKMAYAYVVDRKGNKISSDTSQISLSLEGNGTIVGNTKIGANPVKAYHGVASFLVRSGQTPGVIKLKASAKGIKPGEASITTTYYNPARNLAATKPIYDFKPIKLDLARGEGPLLQFGWSPWESEDGKSATVVSKDHPQVNIKLETSDGELDWFDSWGLSSNLPYVGVDGVRAEATAQLILSISGLDQGEYTIRCYHHVMENAKKNESNIQVAVNDAGAQNRILTAYNPPSFGAKLGNQQPAHNDVIVTAESNRPITITFKDLSGKSGVVLNGVEIKRNKSEN